MANDIILEVNGVEFTGFTNISVSKSMEGLSTLFSFTATSREIIVNGNRVLVDEPKVQDEARVFIDGTLISTGFIDDLSISYSADGHSISVSGRDQTGDLIDSSFYQQSKEYKQRDLKRLIEIALKDNGYTNIKVINEVDNIGKLESSEDPNSFGSSATARVADGDTIFSFIDKYAKKLQVLLVTNVDGNIVITREGLSGAGGSLISVKGGENNNILSANLNVTTKDRFRYMEVYSQADNSSFLLTSVKQEASAEDTQIRAPRRKRVSAKVSTEKNLLTNLAKWQVNINRAKGQRYDCKVAGYYTDKEQGSIWKINTLVQVRDDKCQLDGEFLIQGVTYTKSGAGSFTDLSVVNKGAFTLDTETAVQQVSSNNFASNLLRSA